LDGSDKRRVRKGQPFLNKVNQVSIGVLSSNASSAPSVPRESGSTTLRASGATRREGLARRFNTTTTIGNNLATISTRYREVVGGFSQLDQTGTRYQLSSRTALT
jgi:hypothetical protein